MGGYSTSLYLGLALGSFALGPIIAGWGYAVGFAIGGAAGVLAALLAGVLWTARNIRQRRPSSVALSDTSSSSILACRPSAD